MITLMKRMLYVATIAAVAAGLAACGGGQGANKAGARVQPSVTLTLEMPDAADRQGTFFANDVASRSGGSIRIRIDQNGYSSARPANELALARALTSGREDIGYLPARAWAAAGIPAFKALLAPFLATTDATAQAIASGSVARQVLGSLPKQVVGVALVPAELRRVLSTRPPTSPSSFAGLRIRIIDDPQSSADFASLGAHPMEGIASSQVYELIRRGRLDAAETSPSLALSNSYYTAARYLSSYAIFPKFESIVISRRTWNKLSGSQRAAVTAAAADTVRAAQTQVPGQEGRALSQLCQAHVHVATPTAAQLRQLAQAAQPAARALVSDPIARSVINAIRTLPGAGPQAVASPLPASCGRVARSVPNQALGQGPATIPSGVYVVTTTVPDLRAGGVQGPDFNRDITYTTTIANGRWSQTQSPNYPDQGPFSGTYTVRGDQVRWVMLKAGTHGQNAITAPETVTWSYFNGLLRFRVVDVADPDSVVIYTAHPWRKVR